MTKVGICSENWFTQQFKELLERSRTYRPAHILPVIIFSQFAGTSLWFASNGVMADLQEAMQLPDSALGNITSAVQLGFICGTLVFAFLVIADRFSPTGVFLFSAVLSAFFNFCVFLFSPGFVGLMAFRFLTGFFLAGIYPVGMKIASDWYEKGLGKALGYLVGALVLGTAFPHFLKFHSGDYHWHSIIIATSAIALGGGALLFLTVPDGPNRRPAGKFRINVIREIFQYRDFRSAAFGYFGHMWEVYSFWVFAPVMLLAFKEMNPDFNMEMSIGSFSVIAAGTLGCIAGGYLSGRWGSDRVAFFMLLISTGCCLLSPVMFFTNGPVFYAFLLIWGFAVVADSPQFSTLVAGTAPKEYTGSALTIVNCIGFSITIVSIEFINNIRHAFPDHLIYAFLAAGPILGLAAIGKLMKRNNL